MTNSVYIVGRFPPPIDGQTMATQRLAHLLDEAHTVYRVSTSFEAEQHVQADVTLRTNKIRHYLAGRRRLHNALSERPTAPVLWAAISPMPLGHARDLLTVLPAFRAGQDVYAVIHWGNFNRLFRSPLTALSARRMVQRLRGFVFLNAILADHCAAWIPPEKRFVIPNTIDEAVCCTDAEVAAKQANRAARTTLRVLFLSNMIPSKGYLDVLHAVRLLHERGLSLRADFAGRWQSDDEQADFERYVATHHLGEVVVHHGSVQDRAQIKQLYIDADVFLLPTYYPTEAQPLSILEALNAGTPVVTTRHAGIPDMVHQGKEALFVPPRSPEAIAEALRELADADRWLSFSQVARRRFADHFSPEAVRQQWLRLLGG